MMETKTYFASSVPAALEAARKDLGPEAMLVNSRPAPEAARSMGRLEVTFTYDPSLMAPAPPAQPVTRAPQFPVVSKPDSRPPNAPERRSAAESPASPFAALRSLTPGGARGRMPELDEIREQLADLRRTVVGSGRYPPPQEQPSPDPVFPRLCAAGMSSDFAREIVAACAGGGGDRRAAVAEELARRIPLVHQRGIAAGHVLALVGPPGRGKSLTAAKLAYRYGLSAGVPVRILSAGDHGIGANGMLAHCARLLGVPFQACPDAQSLDLALRPAARPGLVLIDTPGLSPTETDETAELVGLLRDQPGLDRHLVLRADARVAEMLHMIECFSPLAPNRLLFTGTEEAVSLCPMIEAMVRSGLGANFAGTGREIAGHLEELDVLRLARTACGDGNLAAAA